MLNTIDFSNNAPEYRLYLCLPDQQRTAISELHTAYGVQRSLNYGGIHNLTFKLPYRIKKDMKFIRSFDVDLVNGDYLIRVERGTEIEYYIITKYVNTYSDGKEMMTVECNFLPYELSYKIVQKYKETKPLYDFIGTSSILHDTLLRLTDWTVSYCNAQIGIQYRSFDVAQTDLLSFLNQLANTYNVILEFDSVNKTVSFKKVEEYGEDTGVVIDESVLKSLEESELHSEIITKLYAGGQNGLTFSGISPTGTDFIEDYSFYMYGYSEDVNGNVLTHAQYMSDSLCKAINAHNKKIADSGVNFSNLLTQRNNLIHSIIPYDVLGSQYKADLDSINAQIDVLMKNNSDISSLNTQKTAKQAQINSNQATIDGINTQIAAIDAQIVTLKNSLSIANNFTLAQIKEKNYYTREKVWTDTKYVDPNDLFRDAATHLKMVSQPILAYQIDAIDILSQLNDSKDWNRVKIGSVITVRFADFGIDIDVVAKEKLNHYVSKKLKVKILNIVHSVDDHSFKITIGNNKNIRSGILKFADLLTKSVTVGATIDFSKTDWDKGKDANDTVTNYINNALDTAKQAILSGNNNCVVTDKRGITITDNTDPNKLIRITNGVIAISNNAGQSFRTAITSTNIVADVLAGTIVVGNNLLFTNSSGSFSFNANGAVINGASLTITNGLPDGQISSANTWNNKVGQNVPYNGVVINTTNGLQVTTSDIKVQTTLNATNGITIAKNTGTAGSPIWTNQFFADANGNLNITGAINATSGTFSGNITASGTITGGNFVGNSISAPSITNGSIVGTSINVGSGAFTVSTGGAVVCSNITINGGSIQWATIDNAPVSSWTNPSYITSTKITSTTIESPNIVGGSITSNTDINVTRDINLGNYLRLKNLSGGDQGILSDGQGNITFTSDGRIVISARSGININTQTGFNQMPRVNGEDLVTRAYVDNRPAMFA